MYLMTLEAPGHSWAAHPEQSVRVRATIEHLSQLRLLNNKVKPALTKISSQIPQAIGNPAYQAWCETTS